jgi:hypothetical protein
MKFKINQLYSSKVPTGGDEKQQYGHPKPPIKSRRKETQLRADTITEFFIIKYRL